MSGRNFFMQERKARVSQLIRMLRKNQNDKVKVPINKIIGAFSLQTGCTHNKIKSYLRELEESDLIEIDQETGTFYKVLI